MLRRLRNKIQTDHLMIDRILIGGTSIFKVRHRSKHSALRAHHVDRYNPFISSIDKNIVVSDSKKLPVDGVNNIILSMNKC